MIVTNKGKDPVGFRDDAGKHILKRNASVEVVGDQHLPYILSLPGIEVAKTAPAVTIPNPFTDDFEEADE